MSQYKNRRRFHPKTTVFYHSSKILPELLEDIIACYLNGKRVCRFCYYRRKSTRLISSSGDRPYCAKCQQNCETVWLMPASRLCENFGNLREIPVPPAPRWFYKNPGKPFGYCDRTDHYSCYEMSATSDIWFAHTIEELVIWTVEREHNCSFSKYIKNHRESSKKHSSFPQPPRASSGYHKKQQTSPRSRLSSRPAKPPLKDIDLDEFEEASRESAEDENSSIYDPEEVEFQFNRTRDIPVDLLEEVITCYRNREVVCKWCFFLDNLQQESGEKERDLSSGIEICAKCNKDWEPVTIIPASRLCRNFANLEWVPVSQPVPQRYPKHPHEYCAKDNHKRCFEVYVHTGFWYAHSLEELVVWTVEKEFQMDFADFEISQATQEPRRPPTKAGIDTTSETVDRYHPREMSFHFVSDIPPDVLVSVARCYNDHKIICRTCFFDSLNASAFTRNPTLTKKLAGLKTCEKGHVWLPIRVLPASPLCVAYATTVAVPPVPNHMQNVKSAFVTCNNKKHDFCYKKSRETNPWFPHSIEEMVIWTVERETGQDFGEIYRKYLPREPLSSTGHEASAHAALANGRESVGSSSSDKSPSSSSTPSNFSATVETVPMATVSKIWTKSGEAAAAQVPSSRITTSVSASPISATGTSPNSSPTSKVSSVAASPWPSTYAQAPPPRKTTPRYSTQSTAMSGLGGTKKAESQDGVRMPLASPATSVNSNEQLLSPTDEVVAMPANTTLASAKKRPTNYATAPSSASQTGSSAPSHHAVHDQAAVSSSSVVATASNESSISSSSPSSYVFTSETVVATTSSGRVPSPGTVAAVVPLPANPSTASATAVPAPSTAPLRSVSPNMAVVPTATSLTQPMLPATTFPDGGGGVHPGKPMDFQAHLGHHHLAMTGGPAVYQPPISDLSLPTGGLTMDDVSRNFPALLDNRATSVQPFLSQAPMPSSVYGPRHAAAVLQGHLALNGTATMQMPPAPGLPIAMDMTAHGLHSSSANSLSQNDNDDEEEEEEVLCCFLCYREFDSAQEIAKHCQGVQHLDIVKRDSGGERVWHWFPPPPDKSPDDFRMCSKLGRCRGRLRCCKAHSAEELKEWSARHAHREKMEEEPLLDQVLITHSSQNQNLLLLSPSKAESQYSQLSISVNTLAASDVNKATSWTITLAGQGWQTLFAVECFLTSPSQTGTENVFKILSIEGDTFFTIKPKSSVWVAQSVKEGILLGRVSLRVRALPAAGPGNGYTCQLRFNIGFRELLYAKLELP